MNTIYVHGGAPKTGTSYVQVLFAQYAQELEKAGVLYPDGMTVNAAKEGKITSGNGIEFANYIEPNLPHKIEDKEKFSSNLAAVLKAANGKDILYSSEFISFKNPDRAQKLANVAQKNGYTMKYILLVRDIASGSYSTYSQRVKKANETRTYKEFLGTFEPGYLDRIEKAKRVLGAENVLIYNYGEHSRSLGKLFFNDILGTDIVVEEQGLVNRSLSTTEAEMLRYLNSIPMGTPRVIGRVTHELSQINNEILDTKTQEAPNAGFAENQAQFLEDRFEDTLKIVNAHIKGQKISSDLDSTKMLQLETMTEVEKTLLVLIAGLISRI